MRIVFATDLHGNRNLYLQLKNYINEKNADVLIIGGDIFEYSPTYNLQVEFIHEFLYDFFIKLDVLTYIISGNCDRIKAIELLNEFKNDGKLKMLNLDGINLMDDIKIFGYSIVPPSPFKIKDHERRDLKHSEVTFDIPCLITNMENELELVEPTFLNNLNSIEEDICNLTEEKSIWVMHSPPHGGKLDLTDANIKAGSKAIRNQIEKVQPILTLHGHIHESPLKSSYWIEKIGTTISINPGTGEELQAVFIELDPLGNINYIEHSTLGIPKIL